VKGLTVAGVNIAGIAVGTLLAIVLNAGLSIGKKPADSGGGGFRPSGDVS
jgi:xanthine/uracil permease